MHQYFSDGTPLVPRRQLSVLKSKELLVLLQTVLRLHALFPALWRLTSFPSKDNAKLELMQWSHQEGGGESFVQKSEIAVGNLPSLPPAMKDVFGKHTPKKCN